MIGNAIDALPPEGGRLLGRTRESTDWKYDRHGVVLTIADAGSGMDHQTLCKTFDAFFTTKDFGGTGLGLWISTEIVDRHLGILAFGAVSEVEITGRSLFYFSRSML